MRKKRMLLWHVAMALASIMNYASIALLNAVWRLEISVLLPVLFIMTLLMGMMAMETKKALIFACLSIFWGTALVTFVMVVPPVLLREGATVVD